MKHDHEYIENLKRLGQESNIFFFKQFQVEDDRSTMKVGTDAVLLGIAANAGNSMTILEVGTGCGVIALILAQRSAAVIDAIEIDQESVIQATENVEKSPWAGRIRVICSSLQEYLKGCTLKYDLMVSNPPFFSRSYRSEDNRRNLSRHDDRLSFEELLDAAGKLLHPDGHLWVILPVRESRLFRRTASENGFHLHEILHVIPKPGKEPNRLIIDFAKEKAGTIVEKSLTLRDAENEFSDEYRVFAHDFYIDF